MFEDEECSSDGCSIENRKEVCEHCGGTGVVTEELDDDGNIEGESTCCVCSGSGYV